MGRKVRTQNDLPGGGGSADGHSAAPGSWAHPHREVTLRAEGAWSDWLKARWGFSRGSDLPTGGCWPGWRQGLQGLTSSAPKSSSPPHFLWSNGETEGLWLTRGRLNPMDQVGGRLKPLAPHHPGLPNPQGLQRCFSFPGLFIPCPLYSHTHWVTTPCVPSFLPRPEACPGSGRVTASAAEWRPLFPQR